MAKGGVCGLGYLPSALRKGQPLREASWGHWLPS